MKYNPTPEGMLCNQHNKPLKLMCVSRYCQCDTRILCKDCAIQHEHHLLVTVTQAISNLNELVTIKQKAFDSMETNLKLLPRLRQTIMQGLLKLEKEMQHQVEQIKTEEAMDQVVRQYLRTIINSQQNDDTVFEHNYLALYLSTMSNKSGKTIHFDFPFNVALETSEYLNQLLSNMSAKVEILASQIDLKSKAPTQISLQQFQKINSTGACLEISKRIKHVTTIFVERPCSLVGLNIPKLSGLQECDECIFQFSLHKNMDLTQSIYYQEFTIVRNKDELFEDMYTINLQNIKLELYNEYTLAISAKDQPFFIFQFWKQLAANQYIQFISKFDDRYLLSKDIDGIIQNKGVIPSIIIELDKN